MNGDKCQNKELRGAKFIKRQAGLEEGMHSLMWSQTDSVATEASMHFIILYHIFFICDFCLLAEILRQLFVCPIVVQYLKGTSSNAPQMSIWAHNHLIIFWW